MKLLLVLAATYLTKITANTATVSDGPDPAAEAGILFPIQAQEMKDIDLKPAGVSDGLLRGSVADSKEDFLEDELEGTCTAKYCSKLYKLQYCFNSIDLTDAVRCEPGDYDDDEEDYAWRDATQNKILTCSDTSATKWGRNDYVQEILPIITCKTSWGSKPNGKRDVNKCWDGESSYITLYRYVEIPGSLKNKAANKCENRCDYEGPKMNSLALWGCCDNYEDDELGQCSSTFK